MRAEECTSEKERMRRMELEMEEKMMEREGKKGMQMFLMFSSAMQQMCGNASGKFHSPSFFKMPHPYQPPSQQQFFPHSQ